MADCTLYTDQELIDKIKEIDIELNSGVTGSTLDTSQSKHSYQVSVRTLREQREYYKTLLQRQNPTCYNQIFGPSIVKYGRGQC